ncbi:hypothetical protein J7E73_29210 [Paenibacillus albidus]|uniref:hypothetical protein n=1 Tax=Paenibacillus albidus TaxID=2041023 RepID=UPI001BE85BB9|nr:hypothetical protein [Paenibacillus albidus]MBT2293121.1 hypothetical protein [Paenibacillus albidus]
MKTLKQTSSGKYNEGVVRIKPVNFDEHGPGGFNFYGSCIANGRLEIILFDSSDPDDMGKIVLSLPEADSLDIRRCQSIVLDSEEDVMKFINEKKYRSKYSFYYDFWTVAYEIISQHYIKLYYMIQISGS